MPPILIKFLSSKTNGLTRRSYESALRQFAIFQWRLLPFTRKPLYDPLDSTKNEQWLSVTPDNIREYLRYAESEMLSVATRKRHLAAIKGLIDEASRLGFYDEQINSYIQNRINPPRGKSEHHTKISPDDQNALLKVAANQPGLRGMRDYLIVRLLLETGIRRFELLNLRCRNITIKAGQPSIFVEIAKRGGTRDISIEQETYRLIQEWLTISCQGAHIDNPLFCPVRERHRGKGDYKAINRKKPLSAKFLNQLIISLVKMAGIESRVTPHSFRVTLITDAIQGGATLRHAQKVAGHTDPRMVAEIYDRSLNSEPISEYRKHKLYSPED